VKWLAALLLLAGCEQDAPPEPPRPGDQPARAPGADCGQVGEALTSLELGNYAPVEERAPKVAAYRAKCIAEKLTLDEGRCVIAARTMKQLRDCPQPVMFPPYKATQPGDIITGLPAACSQYLLTLERYAKCSGIPIEARQSIGKTVVEMRKNWSIFSETTPMPQAVTDACTQGNAAILQAMVSFGC
jgi:hypothetical protein